MRSEQILSGWNKGKGMLKKEVVVRRGYLLLAAGISFFLGLWGASGVGMGRDIASVLPPEISGKANVTSDGLRINFPEESPSLKLLQMNQVVRAKTVLRVTAPARVAVAASREGRLLFDSADLTSLYAQYRQSKATLSRASKNLGRVRDMYANQAATARDLNDAQSEFSTASASKEEATGKLQSVGLNPDELEKLSFDSLWIIADVPESQLREVDKGEEVRVTLSSFPDRFFLGKADAIGAVVDPATRTVKVRVSLKRPAEKLLPGMFGTVDFGNPHNSVISLPVAAVVSVEEENYVFVAKSATEFERRRISLLATSAETSIVSYGVSEGETIVTSGAMLLKGLSFGF